MRLLAMVLAALLLVGCGRATLTPPPGGPSINGPEVVNYLKEAGLEAESASVMSPEDFGADPGLAREGWRFVIPSLGADQGGQVMIFIKHEDFQTTFDYYQDLAQADDAVFSWVFSQGNVLVLLDSDLPEAAAREYETALVSLGQFSTVKPLPDWTATPSP